jgi:hypothetical protein
MTGSLIGQSLLEENLFNLKLVGGHLKRPHMVFVTVGLIKNLCTRATISCDQVTLLTSPSAKCSILLKTEGLLNASSKGCTKDWKMSKCKYRSSIRPNIIYSLFDSKILLDYDKV